MNTTIKEEEGKMIALFSGRFDTLAAVQAAKDDTTDENGEDHIHLLDAETRSFVSSNYQLHVNLF